MRINPTVTYGSAKEKKAIQPTLAKPLSVINSDCQLTIGYYYALVIRA